MPISEELKKSNRELKLIQPCLVHPSNDLGFYNTVIESDLVPPTASPSVEFLWVALQIPKPTPDWQNTPSKAAATWLRRLRLRKALRDKFWADSWAYFMENRLALELKAIAPRSNKTSGAGRGVRTGGDAAVRASMGRSIEGGSTP